MSPWTSHADVGPLLPFHAAGVLGLADVQVAAALMRIGGHPLAQATTADGQVALAAALCLRALRSGSVCVDLSEGGAAWPPESGAWATAAEPAGVEGEGADLAWPEADAWVAGVRGHPLVAQGAGATTDLPLRLVGSLLYLQRYWLDEQVVATEMRRRAALVPIDEPVLAEGLARLFPSDREPKPDRQRLAAATAALRLGTVVAGGPGTGKTTTVARIVALLRQLHGPELTVALAAPTGKAAARLAEAVAQAASRMEPADRNRVGEVSAATVHRLLGWRPDSSGRFRHDRSTPLPHDVVIVDEASMVSLPLMARLLEAVRPDARLVLVGDPDQLASIEAGAVLGDLVEAPPPAPGGAGAALRTALAAACPMEVADGAVTTAAATGVVTLERNYRFGGGISELAAAIRTGDAEVALAVLATGAPEVRFLDVSAGSAAPGHAEQDVRGVVVEQAAAVEAAARLGDDAAALAGLERHRVLCAHREGPHGVQHWTELVAAWTAHLVEGSPADPWYVGRPLLVTANDYALGLYNGDTGVVVADGSTVRASFARGTELVQLPPARLEAVETLHAMTIHRGQGSQFDEVTVILPPEGSPLLTRELLYTAVTRARLRLRIVGTPGAIRSGVLSRVRRASGLRG